jgi:hypothetical protein
MGVLVLASNQLVSTRSVLRSSSVGDQALHELGSLFIGLNADPRRRDVGIG